MSRRFILPASIIGILVIISLFVLITSMQRPALPPNIERTNMAMALPSGTPLPTMTAYATQAGERTVAQTTPQPSSQRLIIRNAQLGIVVTDVRARINAVSQMAEEMGGWVVSASTSRYSRSSDADAIQGVMNIRIPSERFSEAVERIKADVKSVSTETITGNDVTDAYTDMASQLKNLEAAEAQLRKIMDAATQTQDVITVYRELTRVRGEIETIRGRMLYYEQAAAHSSISITITPELPPAKPSEPAVWNPGVTVENAAKSLVRFFQEVGNALIWVVVFGLPILLVVGIPAFLLWRIAGRRLSQRLVASVLPEKAK